MSARVDKFTAASLDDLQRVIEEYELPKPGLDPYPLYAERRRTNPISFANHLAELSDATLSGSASAVGNSTSVSLF